MKLMRRLWAIVLLGLTGLSLAEPALLAGPETQLPECCRRMGQHRCASTGQDAPGVHFRNASDRCPYFPGLPASPVQKATPLLDAARVAPIVLAADEIPQVQPHFRRYAALDLSQPKRGPPR